MSNLTKTTLSICAVGLLSCGLFCQQASAVPITGDLSFTGSATFNTNSLAMATQITAWSATDQNGTGDFSEPTSVTLAVPYIFNPSTPTPGLWSSTGFTFDLASSTIDTQTTGLLIIFGRGTLSSNQSIFDPTPGDWVFRSESAGGGTNTEFSFSADTNAVVADGGSAVALLGLALGGLEGVRRMLRARTA